MTNTDFTARCMAGKAIEDVAGKQDVITDLDTIRAGAAAGATAVQPAALSDYQPKIDSTHKLDADLIDDANSTNKFATQAELEQIELNKNNISFNQAKLGYNLLPITAIGSGSTSSGGITFNCLNGVITFMSGTASANPTIIDLNTAITIPAGTYYLSGCPSGGGSSTYRLDVRKGTTTDIIANDSGDGATFTLTSDTICRILLRVNNGYQVSSPVVFEPMISRVDAPFEPYAMSNAELTAKEEQLDNNKLSMAQAYGYDVGYALSGTVDLDNLTTVGVYYYTAAAGTTITHAPTSSPFRLEVIQSAGAARYCQFMFANAENALYFRNLVGSTWTGWYKIDATAV